MVQTVEWSLPTSEVRGLSPINIVKGNSCTQHDTVAKLAPFIVSELSSYWSKKYQRILKCKKLLLKFHQNRGYVSFLLSQISTEFLQGEISLEIICLQKLLKSPEYFVF